MNNKNTQKEQLEEFYKSFKLFTEPNQKNNVLTYEDLKNAIGAVQNSREIELEKLDRYLEYYTRLYSSCLKEIEKLRNDNSILKSENEGLKNVLKVKEKMISDLQSDLENIYRQQ